jgi:hypothetical protein
MYFLYSNPISKFGFFSLSCTSIFLIHTGLDKSSFKKENIDPHKDNLFKYKNQKIPSNACKIRTHKLHLTLINNFRL